MMDLGILSIELGFFLHLFLLLPILYKTDLFISFGRGPFHALVRRLKQLINLLRLLNMAAVANKLVEKPAFAWWV